MTAPGKPRYSRGLIAAVLASVALGCAAGGWLGRGGAAQPTATRGAGASRPPAQAPRRAPGEADIHFSVEPDGRERSESFLPAGKAAIYGSCELSPEVNVVEAVAGFSWDGGPVQRLELERVSASKSGGQVVRLALKRDGGFPPGVAEVEVQWQGRRVARGSFVTAAGATEIAAQQVPASARTAVTAVKTARGVDDKGQASGETKRFTGEQRVWLCFAYRGATTGAVFTVRWSRQEAGSAVMETTVTAQAAGGNGCAWIQAPQGKLLPPGEYRATVVYGTAGAPLGEASFEVTAGGGAGQAANGGREEKAPTRGPRAGAR